MKVYYHDRLNMCWIVLFRKNKPSAIYNESWGNYFLDAKKSGQGWDLFREMIQLGDY